LSPNNAQVKSEQKAWLKNREHQAIIGNSADLKYRLEDIYEQRIVELLKDQSLRTFFLKSFINTPLKGNRMVSILAVMSQIEKDAGQPLWLNVRVNMLIEPLIMPITKQLVIVALMLNQEQYRKEYKFLKVSYVEKEVKVESFYLPQPKTVKLSFVGELQDSITGDFSLTKKNDKYLLSYYVCLLKDVKGEGCVWQIDKNGIEVIEEIRYNSQNK
jgi:hypothetical protein